MKNKKGFTLIELLAVIVILSIIALIATPIVLNTIEKSRKNAAIDSVYGYIESIEKQNALAHLSSEKYEEITSGNITNINSKVNVKGTKPTSGTVTIDKGSVTQASICVNGYTVTYDGTKVTNTEKGCSEQNNNQTTFNGTIQLEDENSTKTYKGIAYLNPTNLEVSCDEDKLQLGTGCLKFYIFDTRGNNYKMILDHNTTATVAWNSDEENSNSMMKEVKEALENDTTGWIGSPRLISADEVAYAIGSTVWQSSTATQTGGMYFGSKGSTAYGSQSDSHQAIQRSYYWLFDYTNDCTSYGCNTADSSTKGYWTSTPLANDEYYVWMVYRTGYLGNSDATNDDLFGVRPVIEISKSIN